MVLGLAPAAHGANRTGRVFTGDRSGDWLFRAMHRAGLANQPTSVSADDGLRPHRRLGDGGGEVRAARQPAAAGGARRVRAVPAARAGRCSTRRGWWCASAGSATTPRAATSRWRRDRKFGHGVEVPLPGGPTLLCSFHPSQQNTFTGRLTEPMLDAVFARAVELAG